MIEMLYVLSFVLVVCIGLFLSPWARKFVMKVSRNETTSLLWSPRACEDVFNDAYTVDIDEFPATDDDYVCVSNLIIKGLKSLKCREEEECKLVSIFGPARQGKSFLLSQLRGSQLFAEQDKTPGIYVSRPCYTDELPLCNSPRRRHSRDFVVAFADTVGLYRDVVHDARVVAPLIGLSKVVIFNWLGGFQKNKVFHHLRKFLTKFTAMIPSLQHRRVRYLHIVLRDANVTSEEENAIMYERLFLREPEYGNSATERNCIRERINNLFSEVNVWCIPRPNKPIRRNISDGTSEGFKTHVDRLRAAIVQQLSQASARAASITCRQVAEMLPLSYLPSEACSFWAAKGAIVSLQNELFDFSQNLRDRFPISQAQLKVEFETEVERLKDLYILNDYASLFNNDVTAVTEAADRLCQMYYQQAICSNETLPLKQIKTTTELESPINEMSEGI